MARVFHPVAVHFKGKGFYNTDYGTRKRSRELKDAAEGSGKEAKDEGGSKSDKGDGGSNELRRPEVERRHEVEVARTPAPRPRLSARSSTC